MGLDDARATSTRQALAIEFADSWLRAFGLDGETKSVHRRDAISKPATY